MREYDDEDYEEPLRTRQSLGALLGVQCPLGGLSGKALGRLLTIHPGCHRWLAMPDVTNPAVVCELGRMKRTIDRDIYAPLGTSTFTKY